MTPNTPIAGTEGLSTGLTGGLYRSAAIIAPTHSGRITLESTKGVAGIVGDFKCGNGGKKGGYRVPTQGYAWYGSAGLTSRSPRGSFACGTGVGIVPAWFTSVRP